MKTFARRRPVATFLLINFAWTWVFWLSAVPFRNRNDLLVRMIVILGGYGPALAGILTLALRGDRDLSMSRRRTVVMVIAAAVIFGVMALRYGAGNIPDFSRLAGDLTLSAPIVVLAVVTSLVGGWVISSAVSENDEVRERMASILPWRLPIKWTVGGILFYPAMILIAWGLALVLGVGVEYPGLWGRPLLEVVPIYALSFALTALAQGGMEEPGWRGLMQPELQKLFSPLVAALIVSVFWSLWHLPLFLNGFYADDLISGMVAGGIFRVLLSIFLAWFYNRSGGNLFLMMWLHTNFNVMVDFLPTSNLGLTVLWLIVVIVLVFADKMYRRRQAPGTEGISPRSAQI